MKRILLMIFLAACSALFAGCNKNQDAGSANATSPAPASGAATRPAGAQSPAASAPVPKYISANAENAPAQNVAGEVNEFLTAQLKIFVQQKGRPPQSFAEFAAARLDSVPLAPTGTKWVIDATTVQIKAVKTQ